MTGVRYELWAARTPAHQLRRMLTFRDRDQAEKAARDLRAVGYHRAEVREAMSRNGEVC